MRNGLYMAVMREQVVTCLAHLYSDILSKEERVTKEIREDHRNQIVASGLWDRNEAQFMVRKAFTQARNAAGTVLEEGLGRQINFAIILESIKEIAASRQTS